MRAGVSRTGTSGGKAGPAAGLLLALATLALAGCGSLSEQMSEKMSHMPGIGLPADAPAKPAPQAYPAVLDMPPPRPNTVLSDSEQQKLENDLVAARSRQNSLAGKAAAPEPGEPGKKQH
jgi:hypothetical protein